MVAVARDTEVGKRCLSVGLEQNVLRLQVAMHLGVDVQRVESQQNLLADGYRTVSAVA